jgi:glycosyltransferase involved in cell wall biosynthesis
MLIPAHVRDRSIDDEIILSVIIPAYNEESIIESTLLSVHHFFADMKFKHEVIVVDDGSMDKTAETVSSLMDAMPELVLITLPENRGKGTAVKEGMLKARGTCRLFMDADNSTSIEEIRHMMPYFDQGYDIIIGSRGVKGANITSRQPWIRESMGKVFIYFVKLFAGLPFKDTQAGFKIFTGSSADNVFPLQTIPGWIFDVELLVIARELGYEVKEVPITWKHYPESNVSVIKGTVKALADLAAIRSRLRSGKYVRRSPSSEF